MVGLAWHIDGNTELGLNGSLVEQWLKSNDCIHSDLIAISNSYVAITYHHP